MSNEGMFSIAQVERDVGISKDLLRRWEVRYGFPCPLRDTLGDRLYPAEQVEALQEIRRLLDLGLRPGKIVGLDSAARQHLLQQHLPVSRDEVVEAPSWLQALRSHDLPQLRDQLRHRLMVLGVRQFVMDELAQSITQVGDEWAAGRLSVHQEHLFSEQVQNLLREAMARLAPEYKAPRIVLSTLADEPHGLGLLMVEACLRLEQADVINLGPGLPTQNLLQAVAEYQADVLALSFSVAYPASQALRALRQLQGLLPASVVLWAGGRGLSAIRKMPAGVIRLPSLHDIAPTLQDWRHRNVGPA